MLILIIITVVSIIAIILGLLLDIEILAGVGVVSFFAVLLFGWLLAGGAGSSETVVNYYSPHQQEVRFFQYGNNIVARIQSTTLDEDDLVKADISSLREIKKTEGDWFFKVTEGFNIYGSQNETDVEIVKKEEIDPSLLQHLE